MIVDQNRASKMAIRQYQGTGPAASGVLNLDSDIVPAGRHWILECLLGIVYSTAPAHPVQPGFSGLYLCPQGTGLPAGSAAANPTIQDLANSRPIKIPCSLQDDQLTSSGPTGFSNVYLFKVLDTAGINVPQNWFVRLVLQHGNGFAVSAGALSYLAFTLIEEENCE